MKYWLDAHLSPKIAEWFRTELSIEANTLKELGLRDAEDGVIFHAARLAGSVIITKDVDFIDLQERLGPPPCILWLTCGNTSNEYLKVILSKHIHSIQALFEQGECLIEISK
jgi:predicted nuclease of predicted toxin-antitoxin system